MTIMTFMLAILAVAILLPIAPAWLLFKALPSTGNVEGRLQGMEFKLGGAFSGYFIVLVLILSQLSTIKSVVLDSDQVWTVEGRLVDEHGRGIEPFEPTDIAISPPQMLPGKAGQFRLRVATSLAPAGNGFEFPTLFLGHKGYDSPDPVTLGPPARGDRIVNYEKSDARFHRLVLKDIKLQPARAYAPAGPAPTQVATASYLNTTSTSGH